MEISALFESSKKSPPVSEVGEPELLAMIGEMIKSDFDATILFPGDCFICFTWKKYGDLGGSKRGNCAEASSPSESSDSSCRKPGGGISSGSNGGRR